MGPVEFLSTLGGDAGGFHDLQGSTFLVHSVGGWAALIAIYILRNLDA